MAVKYRFLASLFKSQHNYTMYGIMVREGFLVNTQPAGNFLLLTLVMIRGKCTLVMIFICENHRKINKIMQCVEIFFYYELKL